MDRRKFFRVLPLSLLGLPAALKAEPEKPAEPSPWSEMVCQREERVEAIHGYDRPACGTRFKFLRVDHTPYCPACGYAQDMSRNDELRQKISGIEVKK